MENWWPKNGSIPSRNKKRRIDLKFAVTDGATDGYTDRVNDKK